MSFPLLLALGFALSMDAFAISITNGMCTKRHPWKTALTCGLAFGISQGLMPLIGYWAGKSFSSMIEAVDHWIALILLSVIGIKMIVESVQSLKKPSDGGDDTRDFSLRTLIIQAVATSIDALAVGVSLGVMQVNLWLAVGIIAAVTFMCCFIGVFVGKFFGSLFRGKAEIIGGVMLVLIGLHIFIEHMQLHYFF